MEIYYQLENMDFGLDKLIQLRDTLLEVAKIKKKTAKEASKEFVTDIYKHYY